MFLGGPQGQNSFHNNTRMSFAFVYGFSCVFFVIPVLILNMTNNDKYILHKLQFIQGLQ